MEPGFLEDGLVVPGRYAAFSRNQDLLNILCKELETKTEKFKHLKLEVMPPKIKNNINLLVWNIKRAIT